MIGYWTGVKNVRFVNPESVWRIAGDPDFSQLPLIRAREESVMGVRDVIIEVSEDYVPEPRMHC